MHELKPDDASVSGQAAVIRAADKLQAQPAVLRATIHVTRAGTGKVDTYELVGTPAEPKKEP
jgi:hypothetical protein